jgi:hypothetical protein
LAAAQKLIKSNATIKDFKKLQDQLSQANLIPLPSH